MVIPVNLLNPFLDQRNGDGLFARFRLAVQEKEMVALKFGKKKVKPRSYGPDWAVARRPSRMQHDLIELLSHGSSLMG
jgi:hypothetical protein